MWNGEVTVANIIGNTNIRTTSHKEVPVNVNGNTVSIKVEGLEDETLEGTVDIKKAGKLTIGDNSKTFQVGDNQNVTELISSKTLGELKQRAEESGSLVRVEGTYVLQENNKTIDVIVNLDLDIITRDESLKQQIEGTWITSQLGEWDSSFEGKIGEVTFSKTDIAPGRNLEAKAFIEDIEDASARGSYTINNGDITVELQNRVKTGKLKVSGNILTISNDKDGTITFTKK